MLQENNLQLEWSISGYISDVVDSNWANMCLLEVPSGQLLNEKMEAPYRIVSIDFIGIVSGL